MPKSDIESVKRAVSELAMKEKWKPADLQYAEDYIDQLFDPNVKTDEASKLSRSKVAAIKRLMR